MEPNTKKIVKTIEAKDAFDVEKSSKMADTNTVKKAPRIVVPSKVAKTARGIRAVKSDPPTEPISKVTPVKSAQPAKIVKKTVAVIDPKPVEGVKIEPASKTVRLDLAKPQRLSSGQRTYIRRLKQLARQEGVANQPHFIQRSTAK